MACGVYVCMWSGGLHLLCGFSQPPFPTPTHPWTTAASARPVASPRLPLSTGWALWWGTEEGAGLPEDSAGVPLAPHAGGSEEPGLLAGQVLESSGTCPGALALLTTGLL